jgi:hypothetical protein
MVFSVHPGKCLNSTSMRPSAFLLYPFQFIIQQLSCHLLLCNLRIDNVVKYHIPKGGNRTFVSWYGILSFECNDKYCMFYIRCNKWIFLILQQISTSNCLYICNQEFNIFVV